MTTPAQPFDPNTYVEGLGLPVDGRRDLEYIAGNEPGRAVRSSPFNSAGRRWSPKNGGAIQYESRTLERPFMVQLEHDPDVLRYFDQPPIKITFVHEDPES